MTVHGSDGVNPLESIGRTIINFVTAKNSTPPKEPGEPTSAKKMQDNAEDLAKHEGITAGDVGKGALRVLAGVTGGVLYGAAFLAGGAGSLLGCAIGGILALPVALVGAGIGAIAGSLNEKSSAASGAKDGFIYSGGAIFALVNAPGALASLITYNTIGKMGASCLSFAATGKDEFENEMGNIVKARIKANPLLGDNNIATSREKTPNEKLVDTLFKASFPLMTIFDENYSDVKKSTKPIPKDWQ
jgi:hypothetical protein